MADILSIAAQKRDRGTLQSAVSAQPRLRELSWVRGVLAGRAARGAPEPQGQAGEALEAEGHASGGDQDAPGQGP